MQKKTKSLKYRDLPWQLRDQVDFTYGHIQKAQNPTVKHILKRLKKFEEIYKAEGAEVSVQEKREAINKLESYIQTNDLSI